MDLLSDLTTDLMLVLLLCEEKIGPRWARLGWHAILFASATLVVIYAGRIVGPALGDAISAAVAATIFGF